MRADGYTGDHTGVDFAGSVIQQLLTEHAPLPAGIRFEEQDARQLPYASASFDTVLDKGTIDAMLCGDEDSGQTTVSCVFSHSRVGILRVHRLNDRICSIIYRQLCRL